MKVLRLFILFLLIVAAGYNVFLWTITFDKAQLQNNSNGAVEIIGHGGIGFNSWFPFKYFPSNSYGSLFKALNEYGADGVEIDLHLTADGQFVLFHDSKMENSTALSGCPSDRTLDELKATKYKLGAPFDWFHDERIIGFEELIDTLKKRETFPIIHLDIRNWSECNTTEENVEFESTLAKALITFLKFKEIPKEKVLLISLSQNFLQQLKKYDNPYPVSFEIVGREEDLLQWAIEYGVNSVTVKPRLLTKELSKNAHEAGIKVITFGAKSKSGNKKLLELNPDVIQTDNIPALQDLLGY